MIPAAPASSRTTRARIDRFRLRLLTRELLGRQDEQQPAIVVVGGKDVGLGRLGAVALRVHHYRLVEHPHSPLEDGAYVVVPRLELEPEHVRDRTADHVEVAEPRELA